MKSGELHVPRWVATTAVVAALVLGGVLAITLRNWSDHKVFSAPRLELTVARGASPVSLGNFDNGFAAVLKNALPAVVNIHSSKIVKQRQNEMPFFNDPFFRQFFGNQFGQGQPQSQREQSLGSGVIVTSDGTILTNDHVVNGASDIKVQLADRREFQAKVIGTDSRSDIAVLKIEATGLPVLSIGDSTKLQVGDLVFAIGEPYGLGGTATMGIVSAKGRSGLHIENYEDFIQTDASINPGNSGGALIDIRGNLVGVNTAILAGGGGGNQGIGFAIPINMARYVMDQIVAHGKVVRGYLGAYIQDVTPEIAKQFGLSSNRGVLIGDVSPDGPAAHAGIKRGDVVLTLNGKAVQDANELRLHISEMSPGTIVKLQAWRNGKSQDFSVTLGELPEKSAGTGAGSESGHGAMQGVQVETLTPDVAQQLNLPAGTRGVVIDSVDPSSPAAAVGLDRGDVIQEVNHHPVSNLDQYKQALSDAGNQPVLLLINHGGITSYVVVENQ